MKRLVLPPHIGWPLMVVGLLAISLSACVITILAAQRDGGAQVVADYYAQAVGWDAAAEAQAASDALGWTATFALGDADAGRRPLTLTVRDADGAPVEGLRGLLHLARPHQAKAVAQIPLQPDARPGTYRQRVPMAAAGLWDVQVVATRDAARYQHAARLTVPGSPLPSLDGGQP